MVAAVSLQTPSTKQGVIATRSQGKGSRRHWGLGEAAMKARFPDKTWGKVAEISKTKQKPNHCLPQRNGTLIYIKQHIQDQVERTG